MLGIGCLGAHLVGARAQDRDVALSPTLRHEPPARGEHAAQLAKEAVVVGDPMESGRREDRVERALEAEIELEQVDLANVGLRSESLPGGRDHRG